MSNAPVIVGVGQVANKQDDRIVHPVALLEDASRLAFDDAGADLTPHVRAVYSAPLSVFSEEHGGAMLAARLGLADGPRLQSNYSGAGAQRLLADACTEIAAGRIDAALLVGGVADASVRRARERGQAAPAPPTSMWSQGSAGTGQLERVLRGREWPFSAEQGSGAGMPSALFAIIESAMAADAGRAPDEHRQFLGELLAPFTDVAATRPEVAWFPRSRSAAEIATVSPENRFVAEPYTKLMCSFPTVDLAAAVAVVSSELADRLGIAAERRVHPLAVTLGRDIGPASVRPDIGRSRGLTWTLERALDAAGLTPDDIEAFDLYSCFPSAVQLGMAAFGIDAGDPRPRSLTGGLPYFGGPGAAYTFHGIASMVERCRTNGGRVGAVVGVGGAADDFSVGLYTADDRGGPDIIETEPSIPDDAPVPVVRTGDGVGVVVAATVLHERDAGPVAAPVIARLSDGTRIGARALDPELPPTLSGKQIVGREVRIISVDDKAFYEPTAAL